jgi:hypothetical protein
MITKAFRQLSLLVCTAVLSINTNLQACAEYYPYGEYLRFSIFAQPLPYASGPLAGFLYHSAHSYDLELGPTNDQNVRIWQAYFKQRFSAEELSEFIYEIDLQELLYAAQSENAVVRFLRAQRSKSKETKALFAYFVFAKKTAHYSSFASRDPWHLEKKHLDNRKQWRVFYTAIARAKKVQDPILKERYAYLAIRTIYYLQNGAQNHAAKKWIPRLYKRFFSEQAQSSVSLWALYFVNKVQEQHNAQDLATIFWDNGEKSNAAFELFNSIKSDPAILQKQPMVRAMSLCQRLDRTLPDLKQLNAKNCKEEVLLYVVQREINKVEDWVLTPYYTKLAPAIQTFEYWNEYDTYYTKLNGARLQSDIAYARELAAWMRGIQLKENQTLWSALSAYAAMMGGETTAVKPAVHHEDTTTKELIERIIALQEVKAKPATVLNNQKIQQILMHNAGHACFLFGVARELEFAGQTTTAACLLAQHQAQEPHWNSYNDFEGYRFARAWSAPVGKLVSTWGFYQKWHLYLDDAYSIQQLEHLRKYALDTLQQTKFEKWLKLPVQINCNLVHDLIGTKYFRAGRLQNAKRAFSAAPASYWTAEPYAQYLRVNPFYTTFYQEHQQSKADSSWLTKPQMMEKALRYQKLYAQTSGNRKAKYALLLGNFYFNATQNGNAWLLRRFEWSQTVIKTNHPDQQEYEHAHLAQGYYLAGSRVATNAKMRAFLLRMAAKCNAKYRKVLKEKYPTYSEELLGNCESFSSYYKTYFK